MLDISDATEITDLELAAVSVNQLWASLESKAELPTTPEEFFAKTGATATEDQRAAEDHRAFARHYLRSQVILRREAETHAVYTKDCSRTGIGLISPVQLYPRQRIQLWMAPQRRILLRVIRCRRIRPNCYECGTIFILK